MTLVIPVKRRDATSLGEFVAGDQMAANLVAGLMGRNHIINGAMDTWQRGTTFNFGANQRGYTADRYFARSDDSGSIAVSRVAVPTNANATLSPFNFYYSAQVTAGSGAATQQVVSYPIEGVKTLSGGKAAVSVLMWADAAKTIGVQLYQGFGGGSFSYLSPKTIPLTTTPTRYTLVFDIPAVTSSYDSTSRLQVVFYLSAGSNFNSNSGGIGVQSGTVNFTGLQVEAGSAATEFEFRSPAIELMLCQRYFRTIRQLRQIQYVLGGNAMSMAIPLSPPMRATPAATLNITDSSNINAGASQLANLTPTCVSTFFISQNTGNTDATFDITLDAEL